MKELKFLYNGIMNDYSIRKNTVGWEIIAQKIERRYKYIAKTNQQFENRLLINASFVAKGSLLDDIKSFAKELTINSETLRNK